MKKNKFKCWDCRKKDVDCYCNLESKKEILKINEEIEGLKVAKKRLKEIGFFAIARQKTEDIRELKRKLIKVPKGEKHAI